MNVLLVAFLLFYSANLAAQEQVELVVVTEEKSEKANIDGTGTYWELMKAIYGDNFQLTLQVLSRHSKERKNQIDNSDIYIASKRAIDESWLLAKQHIDVEYPIHILYKEGQLDTQNPSGFADKIIAGKSKSGLESALPLQSNYYEVESIKGIDKLILNERIDAALVYSYNLRLADYHSSLISQEWLPETLIQVAFANDSKGRMLKNKYDEKMTLLLKANQLSSFYKSKVAYQHANLNKHNKPSINWYLVPKIFDQDTQKLQVPKWELVMSNYFASSLERLDFDIKMNSASAVKKKIAEAQGSCSINVRKSREVNSQVIYSRAVNSYIVPRLYVVRNSQMEKHVQNYIQKQTISIETLLNSDRKIRILIKDNYNIRDKLKKQLSEKNIRRIISIDDASYSKLLAMLNHSRVDGLIIYPSIISELQPTAEKDSLVSFTLDKAIGNELMTYVACHNDSKGKEVIAHVNELLSDKEHQSKLYEQVLNQMDKNSAQYFIDSLQLDAFK